MGSSSRIARIAVVAVVVALVAGACGSTTPSASTGVGPAASVAEQAPSAAVPGPSDAPATGPAVATTDAAGMPLLAFTASDDPTAAAHTERDLVHQVRDDAGMPALIGARGPAAFTSLDALLADYAATTLKDASAIADTGAMPAASLDDPLAGLVASLAGGPPPTANALDAIDISLFAETGFTTSAIMSLFTGLVERAAESNGGTLPREEHREETADGLVQKVDIHTTMTVQTGGGKVKAEITMSATDRIYDAATGSFVALYTSTSTGHFDVEACPDKDGVGAGTYTFETKHELNNVGGAANVQSAGGRSVDAPFRLIDGDNAHLVRIETTMDLKADASGPGTPGGPGPTAPFDWQAARSVPLTIPANGVATDSAGGPTVTGTGGDGAGGVLWFGSAMAQLFLSEVGKEAEKFWRSGKCIELVPSDDTRDVQPDEQIDLTVQAKQAFTGDAIDKPIKAKFGGKQSLQPTDTPVDPPSKFTFKAGHEKGDKGTIDLSQTSVRGIGNRQVVFTVNAPRLKVQIDTRTKADAGLAHYDTKITLPPTDLLPADDGTFQAKGATVSWTTTLTAPKCTTKTYSGSFTTDMTARINPDNADQALFKAVFIPGVLHPEVIHCGKQFSFTGSTDLGVWTALLGEQAVDINGSLTIHPSEPLGSATMTIKITKPTAH